MYTHIQNNNMESYRNIRLDENANILSFSKGSGNYKPMYASMVLNPNGGIFEYSNATRADRREAERNCEYLADIDPDAYEKCITDFTGEAPKDRSGSGWDRLLDTINRGLSFGEKLVTRDETPPITPKTGMYGDDKAGINAKTVLIVLGVAAVIGGVVYFAKNKGKANLLNA